MDDLDAIAQERAAFQRVFMSADGKGVLAVILNDLGYFSTRDDSSPQLRAYANRLLQRIGIIHPENLFDITEALLGTANDKDLHTLRERSNHA